MRPLIDEAIRNAKQGVNPSPTIVARLVAMQKQSAGDPSDDMIRAELFGMLAGFVPTNTIASGNVLEMLLRRPEFMASAQEAARTDDDELLWRCLFETMRFKPINPGPFRECAKDYTIADGSSKAKRIRAGTRLLVSTQSAMFDERRVVEPKKFRPDRRNHEYMLFGYGLHWCIGAFLAGAQITQTLKPLLKKRGLRRAPGRDGQMQTIGLMPAHLSVDAGAACPSGIGKRSSERRGDRAGGGPRQPEERVLPRSRRQPARDLLRAAPRPRAVPRGPGRSGRAPRLRGLTSASLLRRYPTSAMG